jgi:hypothetical protein
MILLRYMFRVHRNWGLLLGAAAILIWDLFQILKSRTTLEISHAGVSNHAGVWRRRSLLHRQSLTHVITRSS